MYSYELDVDIRALTSIDIASTPMTVMETTSPRTMKFKGLLKRIVKYDRESASFPVESPVETVEATEEDYNLSAMNYMPPKAKPGNAPLRSVGYAG